MPSKEREKSTTSTDKVPEQKSPAESLSLQKSLWSNCVRNQISKQLYLPKSSPLDKNSKKVKIKYLKHLNKGAIRQCFIPPFGSLSAWSGLIHFLVTAQHSITCKPAELFAVPIVPFGRFEPKWIP